MRSAKTIGRAIHDRVYRHLIDPWYDRRLGIDVAEPHWPSQLGLTGPHAKYAQEYLGTPAWIFHRAMSALQIDVRRFVFVDYGCGKGRVLVLAAQRPFLRVEGIELSEPMHRIACENIARAQARGMLRAPLIAHRIDAADYVLPPEPLVVYLFDPFGAQVVSLVADNIEASLRDNPREVFVVYLNAEHRDCFAERPCLEEVTRSRVTRMLDRLVSRWSIVVYRARFPS